MQALHACFTALSSIGIRRNGMISEWGFKIRGAIGDNGVGYRKRIFQHWMGLGRESAPTTCTQLIPA